eukprot:Phypoly_transcript_10884.p1 GENE.Phypoly_transcript_10884~~Phypoly_transcript_10884.p1  ORF type:complete len:296 (+),score=21.97 Phypoly_transcript_10884:283-1170(+)
MTTIRPIEEKDIEEAVLICFNAFETENNRTHGRRLDFPSVEITRFVFNALFANPAIRGIVALDEHGKILGSNWISTRKDVAPIGPLSVSATNKNKGVGYALMAAALEVAKQHQSLSVRLLQDSQNYVSFSLYLKLGFEVQDIVTVFEGHIKPYSGPIQVRRVTEDDVEECAALHAKVVGFSRHAVLQSHKTLPFFLALSESGEIVGFGTGVTLWSFLVTKSGHEDAIHALHSAFSKTTPNSPPLLKVNCKLYPALAKRCLIEWGLKTQRHFTVMSYGPYAPPSPSEGIYVPSIEY